MNKRISSIRQNMDKYFFLGKNESETRTRKTKQRVELVISQITIAMEQIVMVQQGFIPTPPTTPTPHASATQANQKGIKTYQINCDNNSDHGYGKTTDIYETGDDPHISGYMYVVGALIHKIVGKMKEALRNDFQQLTTQHTVNLEDKLCKDFQKLRDALSKSPNTTAATKIIDNMTTAVTVTDNLRKK